MSRARNIKPGFFTNGDLLECEPLARLLFAGLWCEADRRGVLEDRPKTLKVKILPGDSCDIEDLLTQLAGRGFIERYQVDGIRCIYISGFDKHQNPHMKEQENGLPLPVMHQASTGQAPDKTDASPADPLNLDSPSLNPDTGSLIVDPLVAPDGANAPKTKRKAQVPDSWQPDDKGRAFALERGVPESEIDDQVQKFRDYHIGKGTLFADFSAAWRTWSGNYLGMRRSNVTHLNRPGRLTTADHVAAAREAEERERRLALGGQS